MDRSHRLGKTKHHSLASTALVVLVMASCGDDGGSSDTHVLTTGFVDDGLGDGATSQDGEGLDDTGAGAGYSAYCLYDPDEAGSIGHRYQCSGSVAFDVAVSHVLSDSPEMAFFELSFGHDVIGDSYEDPLVMACCPEFDLETPNCEQPHERACFVDLVEQGCKSMVGKIEDFAHEQFPGLLDAAKRKAVLQVADYLRTHQDECWAAFRDDTGISSTPAACDENDNSVDYTSMLEDGTWVFDPPGAVELVDVTVAQAEWHGLFPLGEEEGPLADCVSADDNDDVMFLEVDPPAGSKIMHLVEGRVELIGPGVTGVGELDSVSSLAVARASLENLAIHSAGATVVLAGDAAVPIDAFHVRLWGRVAARVEENTLTIEPGEARFAVGATALGRNAVKTATNATPIVITHDADGWRTSSFSIAHLHQGEEWSLAVAPARWQEVEDAE